MGQWVGDQGWPKVACFSETCPVYDVTSRTTPTKTEYTYMTKSISMALARHKWSSFGVILGHVAWPRPTTRPKCFAEVFIGN